MADNEDMTTFCGGDCGFNESFRKFIEEMEKEQAKEIGDEKDTPKEGN